MMTDEFIAISENKKINDKYYKLVFRSKPLSRNVRAGQFMNIQLNPGLDPFLRRPFSYYRVQGDRIEILYEVLGRGTAILASKKKGDRLKVMGPLGKPFSKKLPAGKKRVLVGGGVGVPPLVFLTEHNRCDYFLIGTKSKDEVMPRKEMAGVQGEILYSTNDGSYGKKGFVTALLEELLKKEKPGNLFIQTCGPGVMMKAVWEIARREKIEGEASLDKPMACGVGVCLGCMVKTKKGWTPSCVEGPVFRFDAIEEW